MSSIFRDIRLPSRHDDRIAHERFLLDTYADRRPVVVESRRDALARRLRALVGRP